MKMTYRRRRYKALDKAEVKWLMRRAAPNNPDRVTTAFAAQLRRHFYFNNHREEYLCKIAQTKGMTIACRPVFLFFSLLLVAPSFGQQLIRYEDDIRGILIDTYWGTDSIRHKLLWDNHSPTWANEKLINGNRSISRSARLHYRTTTAEGRSINGEVYSCKSIYVGGIKFNDVLFYKIPGKASGAIGENIIKKGVWKIDFREKTLTFGPDIGSIGDVKDMEVFPAVFSDNGIHINVNFRNNISGTVELDLGFNGGILMPPKAFKNILKGNPRFYTNALRFLTPGHSRTALATHAGDTVQIGDQRFRTIISSDDDVKESLIGLGFFQQFRFLVLDYINHAVYYKKH